mmetsp:Transcript_3690/g.8077  ORF Transcript_3690/g.8077 Transcript_3690/m.8077 type:complete len:126 (+) Transcript_3690:650-1027(+)
MAKVVEALPVRLPLGWCLASETAKTQVKGFPKAEGQPVPLVAPVNHGLHIVAAVEGVAALESACLDLEVALERHSDVPSVAPVRRAEALVGGASCLIFGWEGHAASGVDHDHSSRKSNRTQIGVT